MTASSTGFRDPRNKAPARQCELASFGEQAITNPVWIAVDQGLGHRPNDLTVVKDAAARIRVTVRREERLSRTPLAGNNQVTNACAGSFDHGAHQRETDPRHCCSGYADRPHTPGQLASGVPITESATFTGRISSRDLVPFSPSCRPQTSANKALRYPLPRLI